MKKTRRLVTWTPPARNQSKGKQYDLVFKCMNDLIAIVQTALNLSYSYVKVLSGVHRYCIRKHKTTARGRKVASSEQMKSKTDLPFID